MAKVLIIFPKPISVIKKQVGLIVLRSSNQDKNTFVTDMFIFPQTLAQFYFKLI